MTPNGVIFLFFLQELTYYQQTLRPHIDRSHATVVMQENNRKTPKKEDAVWHLYIQEVFCSTSAYTINSTSACTGITNLQ